MSEGDRLTLRLDDVEEHLVDEAARLAFGGGGPEESVLRAMERSVGFRSRVELLEIPGDRAPVVTAGGDEQASSDCRYEVLGEIAHSERAVILRCRDKDLGRDVAVKMLRGRLLGDPGAIERFIGEAQITGQLQSPGVVPIYNLGLQPDGRPYFAMKLVGGRTLAALLEEPERDRRPLLSVFEQICQTIAHAHARGVFHGNLEPRNVLVGSFGEVHVIDWGSARLTGPDRGGPGVDAGWTRAPTEGADAGTLAYVPPEQALGRAGELDERSDVFALGAILCHILTGAPPYVGTGENLLEAAAHARLEDAQRRLDACDSDPEIVAMARRCIAPSRRDRFPDAGALARALTDHLGREEERARAADLEAAEARAEAARVRSDLDRHIALASWERGARRRTLALAASVVTVAVLAGAGLLVTHAQRRERQEMTAARVCTALAEAKRLEGRGDFADALRAAARADELARTGEADAATRADATGLLSQLHERKEEADAAARREEEDRAVRDTLAEVEALWALDGDAARARQAFAAAFRDYGIDVERLPVAEAVAALRGRAIAIDLAASIDAWASLDGSDRSRLDEIAGAADPDPGRNRVRAADAAALGALAGDAAGLPPRTAALLGRALLRADDPGAAAAVLRDAYLRQPSHYPLLVLLAAAARRIDPPEWEEAGCMLAAALALRPESRALRTSLGLALAEAGDLDDAIAALREALDRAPGEDLYRRLGTLLARKGDRPAAVEAFGEALRLAPRSAATHAAYGAALRGFGEHEEAIRQLDEAVRLDAGDPETLCELGRAYEASGDLGRAAESFEMAIRLDPGPGAEERRLALGRIHLANDRPDDAIRALRGASHEPGALHHLGRAYQSVGQLPAALVAFTDTRWGQDARSRVGAAEVLLELGHVAEAERVLRAALRAQPDFALARCQLGRVLFEDGRFAEGIEASRGGHELGARLPGWDHPSGEQLERQRRLLALAERDPAQMAAGDRADHALTLLYRKRYGAAALAFADALDADEGLAHGGLYPAAAAAALAACDEGTPEADRPRWRARALAWLRRDLDGWRATVGGPPRSRCSLRRELGHWLHRWHLASVRDPALRELPEEEQAAWRGFWQEVAAMLDRAGGVQ